MATKKEIRNYAEANNISREEARQHFIDEAMKHKAAEQQTLFDYLSSDKTDELEAVWTVMQTFALGPVFENFHKCHGKYGIQLPADYINEAYADLIKNEGIEYLPSNKISGDVYFMSHSKLGQMNDIEAIVNTMQMVTGLKMKAGLKTRQHVVLMEPDLMGTDKHNEGVNIGVHFEFGPFKIIATNKGGVSSLTFSPVEDWNEDNWNELHELAA
jgi:hypothetical protein